MRFGRSVDDGFLPVFSVNTEDEAKRLLVLACGTNASGEFIARELMEEQALDNLYAFGDRLEGLYENYVAPKGGTSC